MRSATRVVNKKAHSLTHSLTRSLNRSSTHTRTVRKHIHTHTHQYTHHSHKRTYMHTRIHTNPHNIHSNVHTRTHTEREHSLCTTLHLCAEFVCTQHNSLITNKCLANRLKQCFALLSCELFAVSKTKFLEIIGIISRPVRRCIAVGERESVV